MGSEDYNFTDIELDALSEIMNISFGSAAADLADVLDIFVNLNVPEIQIFKKSDLCKIVLNDLGNNVDFSMLEQKYCGDYNGLALLVFPYGLEREVLSVFMPSFNDSVPDEDVIVYEKEVLMEIGNILIGACIGKIFELTESNITYFPPVVISGAEIMNELSGTPLDNNDISVTLKTRFSFTDDGAEGILFLVNEKKSILKLKNALKPFTGGE
ncbi:MAG: chemotaxis protein CheC [Spirochaetales bacterium]|nr:chemotaxis protein CheC [Spirochaetales bacterium]